MDGFKEQGTSFHVLQKKDQAGTWESTMQAG